ncbi:MAG: FMN-binding protein [Oscillospiraceae bacterium]|nr:FMN-binding protein [Oscillospiraceae bacterium]
MARKKKEKKKLLERPGIRYLIVLGSIIIVSTVLIWGVNALTEPVRERNAEVVVADGREEVLPAATNFERRRLPNINYRGEGMTIDSIYQGSDMHGELVGYAITLTSHEGHAGDIQMIVGITYRSNMPPIVNRVIILAMSETQGLGSRAADDEFLDQFIDKTEIHAVINIGEPAGDEILAISGATVTSNAVANAVSFALDTTREVIRTDMMTDQQAQDILEEITEITEEEIRELTENGYNGYGYYQYYGYGTGGEY